MEIASVWHHIQGSTHRYDSGRGTKDNRILRKPSIARANPSRLLRDRLQSRQFCFCVAFCRGDGEHPLRLGNLTFPWRYAVGSSCLLPMLITAQSLESRTKLTSDRNRPHPGWLSSTRIGDN